MKLKFCVPMYHLSVCPKANSCVLQSICLFIYSFSFPWLLWPFKMITTAWPWPGYCEVLPGLQNLLLRAACLSELELHTQTYEWRRVGERARERERALPQTGKRTSSLQVTANAEFPDPSLPLWNSTVLSWVFAGSWVCLNQTQVFPHLKVTQKSFVLSHVK